RLLPVDSVPEIFALEHLLQRHHAIEANDLFELHGFEPFAVGEDARPRRIEHFEGLLAIRFGVGHDRFAAELWASRGPAARVANHRSEIADNQNRLMTEVLKLPQLPED